MSSLLLVLGNGETRRLTVFGLAARARRRDTGVFWYRFSQEEPNELPDQGLEKDISAMEGVSYTAIDLKDYSRPHPQRLKKQEMFRKEWEKLTTRAAQKDPGVVIVEELDTALDAGWLQVSDIVQLVARTKTKQLVFTGTNFPADIMGSAGRIVEIWERENDV